MSKDKPKWSHFQKDKQEWSQHVIRGNVCEKEKKPTSGTLEQELETKKSK